MRLCFFSDGIAEHTRRWTRYFALNGHTVDLVTWNAQVLSGYEPVQVHVVNKVFEGSHLAARAANFPWLLRQVRQVLKSVRPDLIHAHASETYTWLAMLSGFRPYVVTPWGSDLLIRARESRWNRTLTGAAFRKAQLVTCDAVHVKNEVIRLGVPADRVELIMFGTDTARFDASRLAAERRRRRQRFGDSLLVISARTLTPIHDVMTFVRAMPAILSALAQARFLIAGRGSERGSIEEAARRLGVLDKIDFLGHLDEEDMAAWLCASDVYVSTSLGDAGLAASTAEAMACELPATHGAPLSRFSRTESAPLPRQARLLEGGAAEHH